MQKYNKPLKTDRAFYAAGLKDFRLGFVVADCPVGLRLVYSKTVVLRQVRGFNKLLVVAFQRCIVVMGGGLSATSLYFQIELS